MDKIECLVIPPGVKGLVIWSVFFETYCLKED